MIRKMKNLRDKTQTAEEMYYLIKKYFRDLDKIYVKKNDKYIPVSLISLKEFFNIIKEIPYRKDTKPIEVVSRPKHIMRLRGLGMDCKKKGIMIGSYLKRRGIPYRLAASSKKINKRIHHVFPQAFLGSEWLNIDATYPHYNIFQPKRVTNFEVL